MLQDHCYCLTYEQHSLHILPILQVYGLTHRHIDTLLASWGTTFAGDCGSVVTMSNVGQSDSWRVGQTVCVRCGHSKAAACHADRWDASLVIQPFIKPWCTPQRKILSCARERYSSWYKHRYGTHCHFTHRIEDNCRKKQTLCSCNSSCLWVVKEEWACWMNFLWVPTEPAEKLPPGMTHAQEVKHTWVGELLAHTRTHTSLPHFRLELADRKKLVTDPNCVKLARTAESAKKSPFSRTAQSTLRIQ